MKKVLIIHSADDKFQKIANGIKEGLKNNGHQVDLISTREKGRTVTFFPYDLVLVGSPTEGFIKGKIDSDVAEFLKQCKRTAGQEAVAFVTPGGFATNKALKKLMGELEKMGCFVNNFKSIKNKNEAINFGESL